ncbi:hypothetical protein HGRIS_001310 [Hohenbuehelia grisea]|uniref:Uncharacterized protein n=1 Tax=Hohenbuehelia grisea TaxID=104357 RepID=A0ABR3JPZ4_9AGAR
MKEFTNVAREVQRKRSERFIPIKVVPAHARLQERTRYLREWWKQHEQLAVMTGPTKGLVLKAVWTWRRRLFKEAYDVLKDSVEGTVIWVAA